MHRIRLYWFLMTLLPHAAWASDPSEGEKLARRVCSTCHAVTAAGRSPMVEAPTFAALARSQAFRNNAVGLLFKSHDKMPNFAFTSEQAEDVLAYIRTLAPR